MRLTNNIYSTVTVSFPSKEKHSIFRNPKENVLFVREISEYMELPIHPGNCIPRIYVENIFPRESLALEFENSKFSFPENQNWIYIYVCYSSKPILELPNHIRSSNLIRTKVSYNVNREITTANIYALRWYFYIHKEFNWNQSSDPSFLTLYVTRPDFLSKDENQKLLIPVYQNKIIYNTFRVLPKAKSELFHLNLFADCRLDLRLDLMWFITKYFVGPGGFPPELNSEP